MEFHAQFHEKGGGLVPWLAVGGSRVVGEAAHDKAP